MPRLRTDSQGQVKISFTLPESMTSWHLLGAAHTTDMMVGLLDTMVVAEKELMAEMLLPRFVRSGDHAVLTASIRNRSEKLQKGQATLLVSDAETDKVLMRKAVRFQLGAQEDTTFFFPYTAAWTIPHSPSNGWRKGRTTAMASRGICLCSPICSPSQRPRRSA